MTPTIRTLSRRRQAGFGLVELMVALVIGLVLMGGALSVFLGNQQANRTNEDLARLQENARLGFELLAREIRQADGNLCGTPNVANVLNNRDTYWGANWDAGAVRGFDGGTAATDIVAFGANPGERVNGTDAIILLGGGLAEPVYTTLHDTATAQFQVNAANHGITAGSYAMVCGLTQNPPFQMSAALFQVTSVDLAARTLNHAPGPGSPGNCQAELSFLPNHCTARPPKQFQDGSWIERLSSSFWYVGNNARGGRSLFRLVPERVDPDEIAEGVTNLQIDYLLRQRFNNTLDTNWRNADGITWTNAAGAVEDPVTVPPWSPAANKQAVAVRLEITLETQRPMGTDSAPIERRFFYVANLRNRGRL